jgi:hypothetical protein
MLNDIYINDVKGSSSWLSSYKRKVTLDTDQIGNQSLLITGISVTKKSNQMTYVIPFNQLVSYKVLDDLEIVHIPMLLDIHNDIETDNSLINATKGNNLTLLFDNPDNLALSNIMFGVDHPDSIVSNNNETVVLTYNSIQNSIVVGLSEVTSFQYTSNGLTFEQNVTSYNKEHYHLCDYRGVQSVSTPAEFISMIEGRFGCYQLVNDIDMSGYTMNNYYTQEDIRISLYGNGFTVSNITVSSSNVNYASESSWGVFSTLNLAHIEDVIFEVNVSIGNSHSYAPNLYVGGLAGTIKDSYIENVTIIGTVTSNYLKGGAVGGMAGVIDSSIIVNSSTNVLLSATAYDESNPLEYTNYNLLGGLAGIILNSDIERIHIKNAAGFSNNSSMYSMVGGVVAHLQNSSLTDVIVDSGNHLTIGTNSYITGGAVASAINSSINRIYVLDNVTAKGTYLGGLVGYMASSTIKNSFVAMDTIKQTGTSLHNGYILGGYTGTMYSNSIENNHYLDITAIQKGLDQINGSDISLSGITSETLMTLESIAFVETLGYHPYHYDLDAYDTENHYYPRFQ